ncbi:MAG: diiron oxygenase [Cyanobacteria bacterium J06592_8]
MIAIKSAKNSYDSPFDKWDEVSWIRSQPMKTGPIKGLPFPPHLIPLASHPKIAENSEHWLQVLAYKLLGYLRFTTLLELNYVNPITAAIAAGRAPFKVTNEQRSDALRVYCDEGGHALFSEELAMKVEETFELHHSMLGRPRMEIDLEKILENNKSQISPELIKLFFVAISETLISKSLHQIPHDPQVDPLVRAVVADHADDEARHNLYYRRLFPIIWDSLPCYDKEEMGKILPSLVCAFLGPDKEFDYRVLRQIGFKQNEAYEILEEVYIESEVCKSVKKAATSTLKMFEDAGVFNIAAVKNTFADHAYLD